MPQFDVYKDRVGKRYPLLLDVQTDLLAHLETRIVVPLAPRRRYPVRPMRIVNPVITVRETEYVAVFQELAAVAAKELGALEGSAAGQRAELIAALDFVFTGS
jgi:toxin CcdB